VGLWRTIIVGGLLAVVSFLAGSCTDDGSTGSFTPSHEGTLVVASAFLPSAGFWEGPGAAPTGGFEHDLAAALADRFGLDSVEVVRVGFADLVDGELRGADIAISQLTPTGERDEVLDFSTPYLSAPPGVLVRAGVSARDLFELRELSWVALRGSTLTTVVRGRVRPHEDPRVVDSRSQAFDALRHRRADAMLLDLPVALAQANAAPDEFEVIAQLPEPEGLAIALPDGSPNRTAVDTAVRAFIADGTIDDLSERWLGAPLSVGADDVPLIRASD
jgi:polar amino acid transport system substrate-binding protein